MIMIQPDELFYSNHVYLGRFEIRLTTTSFIEFLREISKARCQFLGGSQACWQVPNLGL